MNERIKELKDKAWATCEEPEQYMDKFAELIVQECANVGERYANGNYEVYNQIMEHFGVEE